MFLQATEHPLEDEMDMYDAQERVNFIEFFYSSDRSITETQRKYRQHFNVKESPSDKMIENLIARFERTGSVRHPPVRMFLKVLCTVIGPINAIFLIYMLTISLLDMIE